MLAEITHSNDVRRSNRKRVLDAIRRNGPASRTDISALTGLSAATVSAITSDLISERVLVAQSSIVNETLRGRPQVALDFDAGRVAIATVSLQVNTIWAGVLDGRGMLIAEHGRQIDTLRARSGSLRTAMVGCLKATLAKSGLASGSLRQISVSVQGAADVAQRSMLWSPITQAEGLRIADWLEDATGARTRVHNDCDLMAAALHWDQPQRYGDNFAAVLLSHGVGIGLVIGGRPVSGIVSSAGEFGHMIHSPGGALCRCGSFGCIEAHAADYAIVRAASNRDAHDAPDDVVAAGTIQSLADQARAGHQSARAAFEAAGSALGHGLAGLFALFDPFPVVLIGDVACGWDLFESQLRSAVDASMAGKQLRKRAGRRQPALTVDVIGDAEPLVRRGAAISALRAVDEVVAILQQ